MIERLWTENIHTVEGNEVHKRAHEGGRECRGEVVILRNMEIQSGTIGITGKTDCVEALASDTGIEIPGLSGRWQLVPVEYKHGDVRDELEYELQLCAQALCLEEMTGFPVARGFIYYAGDHRRKEVGFTERHKQLVLEGANELHRMVRSGSTPPPQYGSKCKECSMKDDCVPKLKHTATHYLSTLWRTAEGE